MFLDLQIEIINRVQKLYDNYLESQSDHSYLS